MGFFYCIKSMNILAQLKRSIHHIQMEPTFSTHFENAQSGYTNVNRQKFYDHKDNFEKRGSLRQNQSNCLGKIMRFANNPHSYGK